MSDVTQKSYVRDSHGPRAVESREKGWSESRRRRDGEDDGKQKSKHGSSRRASKHESSHRRKSSSGSYASANTPPRPSLELDIIGQPQRNITFGSTVETSVMVSLQMPSPNMVGTHRSIDINRFVAVVSLVADTRSGERMPIECGNLTGQKMFDSVHPIPNEVAESLARSQPCRLALGYFSFPGMLIRQTGTYRLRVSLIKMGSSGASSGASSVLAVDSEAIKVERRSANSNNPRKYQRC